MLTFDAAVARLVGRQELSADPQAMAKMMEEHMILARKEFGLFDRVRNGDMLPVSKA